MSDPAKIYQNLPNVYSKDDTLGTYQLLAGLAAALSSASDDVDDFIADLRASTADGEGLVRLGEGLAVQRPNGLPDSQYAILITTKAPAPRGTLRAILDVFEAATGLTGSTIRDHFTNPADGIPLYEIWITVDSDSYLYGAYADADTPPCATKTGYSAPWPPEDSCYFGQRPDPSASPAVAQDWVHDALDEYGGEYNDHWWSPVDSKTKDIVDSVKLAGTIIVYKYA